MHMRTSGRYSNDYSRSPLILNVSLVHFACEMHVRTSGYHILIFVTFAINSKLFFGAFSPIGLNARANKWTLFKRLFTFAHHIANPRYHSR